ncbi:endonuclease IV [Peribacillus cavernae]|uniref:Endonuclease IV n=1 Tax=Peribacillus cavernae TaxID=1674310 RepID=A0A3S0U668_9BACI|nr:TIM barrel protein [Peribacillus cavernae]MDQ0218866.1 deoxyribonuclease-4 [Peribacillus cavernae]RUQ31067.1 endonuclease IV [Peribacillus cavernae]
MKFGCHISIKEGYLGAAKQAIALNASAYQFFPKNPRSLTIKDFNRADAMYCKEFCLENQLISIAHSPYPTSLTASKNKREAVIVSLINDLEIADSCGAAGVVVHFGSQISETDPLASYQLMIEMLNSVLVQWEGDCKILLENNAGIPGPGTIGTTLEELVQVRSLCDDPGKIGFCFDTCHAFASGLWNGYNWKELAGKGLNLGYFDHLYAIHLNNSKYGTGLGKTQKMTPDHFTESFSHI